MKKNLLITNFLSLFLFFLFLGTANVNAVITSQPRDITTCESASAVLKFSVVTSTLLPSYQWQVYNIKLGWVNLTDQLDPNASVVISGTNKASVSFTFSKRFPLTTSFSGTSVRCYISS